ncbi:MAG: hypothetical protein BAJALOKI2v1_340018 [Promethearchaeota archaeon]|nr:MAG: hypothetical protein BAJALOKI2v1_340018 [Candidatus Lokiarchaeota archaeon]
MCLLLLLFTFFPQFEIKIRELIIKIIWEDVNIKNFRIKIIS